MNAVNIVDALLEGEHSSGTSAEGRISLWKSKLLKDPTHQAIEEAKPLFVRAALECVKALPDSGVPLYASAIVSAIRAAEAYLANPGEETSVAALMLWEEGMYWPAACLFRTVYTHVADNVAMAAEWAAESAHLIAPDVDFDALVAPLIEDPALVTSAMMTAMI